MLFGSRDWSAEAVVREVEAEGSVVRQMDAKSEDLCRLFVLVFEQAVNGSEQFGRWHRFVQDHVGPWGVDLAGFPRAEEHGDVRSDAAGPFR